MPRFVRRAVVLLGALVAVAVLPVVPPALLAGGEAVSAKPVERLARTDAGAPVVYVTFDAGNTGADTVGPLLDLLEQESVPATFFLTARWTSINPRAARSIALAGHLLANHGSNHFYMNLLPPPVQLAEVWWAEQTIAVVCGRRPTRLYRPPHGGTDASTERFLAGHGYRTIMWSKDPSDWRLDGSVTIESIRSKILPITGGDIVCFHLRNAETVEALAGIIPELKAAGFEFRTLPPG